MKPFDLEAAKRGEPVITRDGTKVGFYDFEYSTQSIVGFTQYGDSKSVLTWFKDGRYYRDDVRDCALDLFMAPKKTNRWVSFYKDSNGEICAYRSTSERLEEAQAVAFKNQEYLGTYNVEIEI